MVQAVPDADLGGPQVIAPLLLIVRVLQGKAWTAQQDSQDPVDNFKFASYAGSSVFGGGTSLAPGETTLGTTSMARTNSKDDRLDTKPERFLVHGRERDLSIEMSRISRNA